MGHAFHMSHFLLFEHDCVDGFAVGLGLTICKKLVERFGFVDCIDVQRIRCLRWLGVCVVRGGGSQKW
jgi:hypothetical protein